MRTQRMLAQVRSMVLRAQQDEDSDTQLRLLGPVLMLQTQRIHELECELAKIGLLERRKHVRKAVA